MVRGRRDFEQHHRGKSKRLRCRRRLVVDSVAARPSTTPPSAETPASREAASRSSGRCCPDLEQYDRRQLGAKGRGDHLPGPRCTRRRNQELDPGDEQRVSGGTRLLRGVGSSGRCISSAGHNILGDVTDCDFAATPSDQVGMAPNPIDPLLGPLADNGGPTSTHALLPGSPAIDAIPVADCTYDDDGDPGTPDVPLTTDQRGVPRPQAWRAMSVHSSWSSRPRRPLRRPTPTATPTPTTDAHAATRGRHPDVQDQAREADDQPGRPEQGAEVSWIRVSASASVSKRGMAA